LKSLKNLLHRLVAHKTLQYLEWRSEIPETLSSRTAEHLLHHISTRVPRNLRKKGLWDTSGGTQMTSCHPTIQTLVIMSGSI
jgi:hypothetical protein